ncbi:MAG: cysteine--tRNA ligase [Candidatus Nealsonbacteria bacterium]
MTGLSIFNSLTQKKEVFKSVVNKKVGLYVCGITPYDVTHLGHAFTYVFFDVLVRYLSFLGYRVTYVQNVTDIDDDILKKAGELKQNWQKVVSQNTQLFLTDMKWLNNLQPDFYPRATDHIKDMISIIKKLKEQRFAYVKQGNVYFPVKQDKEYGKLSCLNYAKMLLTANERGNNPKDLNKRDPIDFVLWQSKKEGEPYWSSPWGEGRPGWHIECSAMAKKYLGKTIDIHGGGYDLIFPHDESSIAQSEKANRAKFARYFMHVGMLHYQGDKMSKSLGNLVLISNLKKRFTANAVRIALLNHHYRSIWEFKEKELKEAEKKAILFSQVWNRLSGTGPDFNIVSFEKRFFQSLNNDFDTKLAIETLVQLSQKILKVEENVNLAEAKHFLSQAFNILGFQVEYGK